jgi:cysteine desulfurase
MSTFVYLDHAATTPLRPEVRQAMEPFLGDCFANPSSIYCPGQEARAAIDTARDTVAACLGAQPSEIVFTSGGTESDNAAIKGVAFARRAVGQHLVTTAIEHHAVLHSVEDLCERFGFESTIVPVGASGIVDPAVFEQALRRDTVLASVMWANNEIGTIQPIEQIAKITKERDIPLHVDAVQAAGLLEIDLSRVPLDLLALSAHKFYGPKGVGVLYVRAGTPWWPLLSGGGQERNRRAGTENVAGIVGLARALELACTERSIVAPRLTHLRNRLFRALEERLGDVSVNGDRAHRLPNNVNVSIAGAHGESMLIALDLAGIMASSGSACAAGSVDPSHVLTAISCTHAAAQSSLRMTLGRATTDDEITRAVDVLSGVVGRLRGLSPAVPA